MTLRPPRLLAIARRDLVQELSGRRGLLFSAVTVLLLLPAAALRVDLPSADARPSGPIEVTGDVPEVVAALPEVRATEGPARVAFTRQEDGILIVRAQAVPPQIRAALDGPTPTVTLEAVGPPMDLPGRSLLFALISASILTGAVSESIGGERSRRTLHALLAAAVTRAEVVVGKWLAWAGYGAAAALATSALAIGLGHLEGGWWLLPMPTVAGGAVALALYLSRHARDVVGGAAVSLRYLPAVLAGTGVAAWYLGGTDPLVGAAFPLGGALLAAGDTWPGPGPALLATLSTSLFTVGLLALTARDLEQPPLPAATWVTRAREALLVALVAGIAWWAPLTAPLLWGAAGNPLLTETLPRAPGVWAGALALLLMSLIRAGQSEEPRRELGLYQAPARAWVLAFIAGVTLSMTVAISGLLPPPTEPLIAGARLRLLGGLQPLWVGIPGFLLTVIAQELLFRGWLQRMVGPVWGTAAFVVVHGALDPVRALIVGGSLAAVTRAAGGSLFPAIGARLLWAVTDQVAPGFPPAAALVVGGVVLAALAAQTRGQDPPPPLRGDRRMR